MNIVDRKHFWWVEYMKRVLVCQEKNRPQVTKVPFFLEPQFKKC